MPSDPPLAEFNAAYAPDDAALAAELLTTAKLTPDREAQIDAIATDLISAIRGSEHGLGSVEAMLREFALSTKEGLALMVLAEALLRVPDAATADAFIEDKLGQGDFAHHRIKSDAVLVNASAWALGLSARLVHAGETPQGTLAALTRRIGAPAVRAATRQAMRLIGNHFVLGETIEAALARAQPFAREGSRYSYDMLGEGARTAADAERYYQSYADAIIAIGRRAGNAALPARPGISVKLSALHPRFEAISRDRVMRELTPRLLELAQLAKSHDLAFTVDAEEADRLELSLEVFAACFADPSLKGWDGYGLAVQAYQKRAATVIDHVAELARAFDRRMMLRLVKGAYWDTEIKRTQERGLADYPVFTRKAMTDLNYLHCARKLLALRPRLFPQFASHNALTVATILAETGDCDGYEFQRLHGMGEALYARLLADQPQAVCRIYAPVGGHRDLLAYLVRRLLENGANSSFVAQAGDDSVPIAELLARPATLIGLPENARNSAIPLPRDLYQPQRINSRGIELGDRSALAALLGDIEGARRPLPTVASTSPEQAAATVTAARKGFESWSRTSADHRAAILQRAGDLLEQHRGELIALLQDEGGKTLEDCLAEVREAVDYCRYYASEGRRLFGEPLVLPGPTGERNTLTLRGRGIFVAISPWNFPLAIFLGQITAALMAGNAVVAKPAEQTPVIAEVAVRLLHAAGVPPAALHLVQGDGRIGAALIEQRDIAGVVSRDRPRSRARSTGH